MEDLLFIIVIDLVKDSYITKSTRVCDSGNMLRFGISTDNTYFFHNFILRITRIHIPYNEVQDKSCMKFLFKWQISVRNDILENNQLISYHPK